MHPLHLVTGRLRTLDPRQPIAEAMVLRGERIEFVGSRRDAEGVAGAKAKRTDFGEHTVLPGFVDCHLHLFWLGTMLARQADLTGSGSIDELLGRLSGHATSFAGPWVQGRGWDQDKLAEGREPTRAELDRVVTDRPCFVTRVCGHAAVANSAAIALLSPEERAAGDPISGRYTETAISAFHRRVPALTPSEKEAVVLKAAEVALRAGVTSVGTLLDTADQMQAYHGLHRAGRLPLRVTAMPPWSSVDALHANGVGTGFGDHWLRFGGAKLFADGSLGARTAWMSAPYADEDNPTNLGVPIYPADELTRRVMVAHEKSFQVVIHAIGDQAVRAAVEAIETALAGAANAPRHRIEHVSVLPPDLRERMARAGILAVVQPQFVTSDTWSGDRLGPERAPWAYPFRTMRRDGIRLGLSSDTPVEVLNPFLCLAAAVGRHPWSPDETLTPEEALHDHTLGSAYSLSAEDAVGSLEAGKLADFVTVAQDPVRCDVETLRALRVDTVWVGGRPAL